jgi:hypothetical protein
MSLPDDFAVLILTHKRPDRVFTYESLRDYGYTGRIFLLVDDEDPTLAEYEQRFPGEVVLFSKREAAALTDSRINSGDHRSVLFARNAAHKAASSLGLRYFLELDDDYTAWWHRVLGDGSYTTGVMVDRLDDVFAAMLVLLRTTPATSVALAQGGDIFGRDSKILHRASRKVMNSFFCSVDRPFKFEGLMNDDVNTYTALGMRGHLFLTVGAVHLNRRTDGHLSVQRHLCEVVLHGSRVPVLDDRCRPVGSKAYAVSPSHILAAPSSPHPPRGAPKGITHERR